MWCYDNALNFPESFPPCELRSLRLPAGGTSADIALREHLVDILRRVILHGDDGGRLNVQESIRPDPRGSGTGRGEGAFPHTPSTPRSGKGGGRRWPKRPSSFGGRVPGKRIADRQLANSRLT